MHSFLDGELNVLEDILTDAPDQDDELYNPESEHDINEKKGTRAKHHLNHFQIGFYSHCITFWQTIYT